MYKITCVKCKYNPITLKPHTSSFSSAKRWDGFFSLWTVYAIEDWGLTPVRSRFSAHAQAGFGIFLQSQPLNTEASFLKETDQCVKLITLEYFCYIGCDAI